MGDPLRLLLEEEGDPSLPMFLSFILSICLIQRAEAKIYLVDTSDSATDDNIQTDTDTDKVTPIDSGNDIQTKPNKAHDYSLLYDDDYDYEGRIVRSRRHYSCKGRRNRLQCGKRLDGAYCIRYKSIMKSNHGQCCKSCCRPEGRCTPDTRGVSRSCQGMLDGTRCKRRSRSGKQSSGHCKRGRCVKNLWNYNFRKAEFI